MEVINNFFKKEPNLSFVTAKIQQNCTDTGNDNSEATRQRINCAIKQVQCRLGKISTNANHISEGNPCNECGRVQRQSLLLVFFSWSSDMTSFRKA